MGELLVALADGTTEGDFPVVDPDIVATLRIGTHPSLIPDGSPVSSVIRERNENPVITLLAIRIPVHFHHDQPLPTAGRSLSQPSMNTGEDPLNKKPLG